MRVNSLWLLLLYVILYSYRFFYTIYQKMYVLTHIVIYYINLLYYTKNVSILLSLIHI